MNKVFARIINEFWIPFVIALLWTIWTYFLNDDTLTIYKVVQAFLAAFFIASWFTGQFVRIQKTMSVENRFEETLDRLDKVADKIVGKVIGTNGFVSAVVSHFTKETKETYLLFVGGGIDPTYDCSGYYYDLFTKQNVQFNIGNMRPGVAQYGPKLQIIEPLSISINVFYQTRAGKIIQEIRMRGNGDKIFKYNHVFKEHPYQELLYEMDEFPSDLINRELQGCLDLRERRKNEV